MARRLLIAALILAPFLVWFGVAAALCEGALRVRTWEPMARARRHGQVAKPIQTPLEVTAIAADGVTLRGSYIPVFGSRRCVMILHGIADSRAAGLGFADLFLAAGFSVLAHDLRSHGESEGDLLTYGIVEKQDALVWVARMRNAGCEQVFGFGESLGGAILIQAAAEDPDAFTALAAECSYRDFRSVAEDRIVHRLPAPDWLARPIARATVAAGFAYARLRYDVDLNLASPLESGRRLKTPLLLIHGLNDHLTPPGHSRSIATATPASELWLVPGAGHTTASAIAPDFGPRVVGFFLAAGR